jgi:ssDNA-binding Zn-finger/Zn-ribbon topoisomerase 1
VVNNGEVKNFYVLEDHPAIVSEEEWQQVQELMQYHKEKRNIQKGNKYQNRYPLSGLLVCPHCGKSLRRRYVYNKRVEWICSTYIPKGKRPVREFV